MRFPLVCIGLLVLAFAATVPRATEVHRYEANPPLAHTGGFDEPTCRVCHFDQPLNASGGSLTLAGVPEAFEPDERYRITVQLSRTELGRGGFELSARHVDGTQAGSLHAVDDRTAVNAADASGVQYAHQTSSGTTPSASDSSRWTLEWTAPSSSEPVVFHVAANAANFDASAFGDFIYTAQRRSNAAGDGE